MSENKIPADIMTSARERASVMYPVNSAGNEAIAEMIARALLAERERCAKVVECFIPASQDRLSEQIAELCAIIAAAIRGGSRE